MNEAKLTDAEIDEIWRDNVNRKDDAYATAYEARAMAAEIRELRALLATEMPDEIRFLTPDAQRHGDGKVWVEASGIGGCWTPDAALAIGAALIRAGLAAKEGK